jgi:hypothetical protein
MSFWDPAYPPFVAQQISCVYPLADRYAGLQRILYYCLLAACFITQHRSWLNKVFLGAAYSYAGSAAINAFVLMAGQTPRRAGEWIDVPFVSDTTFNQTIMGDLARLYPNLVVNASQVWVQPASMDLDLDGIMAVTVTGFLVVLPMQCWSGAVRANRLRYVLVGLWSAIILAGAVCSLVMWPRLFETPPQYSFCAAPGTDVSYSQNQLNTGWEPGIWEGDWNQTVWNIFSNFTALAQWGDTCFQPCFNTTQVLRSPGRLTATLQMKESGRWGTDVKSSLAQLYHQEDIRNLVYVAVSVTVACNVFLLVVTRIHGVTKIPIHEPKRLWQDRREVWASLNAEAGRAFGRTRTDHPWTSRRRLCLDVLFLWVLLFAMVLSPVVVITFIVWIEGFMSSDIMGQPYFTVGQWGTMAQFAFVLTAAVVIRFRYHFAAQSDIEGEMGRTQRHLEKLQQLLDRKRGVSQQGERTPFGHLDEVQVTPEEKVSVEARSGSV